MDALESIGLTPSESSVYQALVQLGDSTRGDIVHASGITSSKIYDVLERLRQKGLVSIYLQDKVKHFKPVHPRQLLSYIDAQREELDKKESIVQDILPKLISEFMNKREEQEAELLMGLKGLEAIFREQMELLGQGDSCYVIGGTADAGKDVAMLAFWKKIHLMRKKRGIQTFMLYSKSEKDHMQQHYANDELVSIKYINHTSPVAINVYADRTAIIIFGSPLTIVHIKSQDVANSFFQYFQLLWTDDN